METSNNQGALSAGPGGKTVRGTPVKRPMNSFLIFCKRHRALMHEKHPSIDNRSVTRMLGDLWKNIQPEERAAYENLSKQNKDAFYKANPDFKWRPTEPTTSMSDSSLMPSDSSALVSPTGSALVSPTGAAATTSDDDNIELSLERLQCSSAPVGECDSSATGLGSTDTPSLNPLNMLLMASQQSLSGPGTTQPSCDIYDPPILCSSLERGKVEHGIVSDKVEDVKGRGKRSSESKDDGTKVKRKRRTKKIQALELAASQSAVVDSRQFVQRSPDSTTTKDERSNRSGSVDIQSDNKSTFLRSTELTVDHDSVQNKLYQVKLVPVLQYGEQQNLSAEQQQQLTQHQINLLLQQTLKMAPYQLLYSNSQLQAAQQLNQVQQQLLANHQSSKLLQMPPEEQQSKKEPHSGVRQLPSQQLLSSNMNQLLQQHIRLLQQNYQLQQQEEQQQMVQLHNQQQQQSQNNNSQQSVVQQLQQQQVLAMALQLAGKLPGSSYTEVATTRCVSNPTDVSGTIRQPWLDSDGKKFMGSSSEKETNTAGAYKLAQSPDRPLSLNVDVGLNIANNILTNSSGSNSLDNLYVPPRDSQTTAISFLSSVQAHPLQSPPKQPTSVEMNCTSSAARLAGYPVHLFSRPVDVSTAGNLFSTSTHSSVVDYRQTTSPGNSVSTTAGSCKLSDFAADKSGLPQMAALRRIFAEPQVSSRTEKVDGSNLNKRMFDKVIEAFHSTETLQDQTKLQRVTAEVRSFPKTKKQQAVNKAEKLPTAQRDTSFDIGSELGAVDSVLRSSVIDKSSVMQSNRAKLDNVVNRVVTSNMTYGEIQEQLILKAVEAPQMLLGDDVRKFVKPAYKYGLNLQRVETDALSKSSNDHKKQNRASNSLPTSSKVSDGRNSVIDSVVNLQSNASRQESVCNEQMKLLAATTALNRASPRDTCDSTRTTDNENSQMAVYRLIENLIGQANARYNNSQHAEKISQSVGHSFLDQQPETVVNTGIFNKEPHKDDVLTNLGIVSGHGNEKVGRNKKNSKSNTVNLDGLNLQNGEPGLKPAKRRKKKKVPTATLR